MVFVTLCAARPTAPRRSFYVGVIGQEAVLPTMSCMPAKLSSPTAAREAPFHPALLCSAQEVPSAWNNQQGRLPSTTLQLGLLCCCGAATTAAGACVGLSKPDRVLLLLLVATAPC
jgi:hypothetical protein